jgi:hypothetical protein
MAARVWTHIEMIESVISFWGDESIDPKDCRVVQDNTTKPPTLVVIYTPPGIRSSGELGNLGRWNLDGTAPPDPVWTDPNV